MREERIGESPKIRGQKRVSWPNMKNRHELC